MGRAVRAQQLGEDGGGAAAVQAADVSDEPFREDGGGLVGVAGAAVEVQVVGGGGVADADDDVEGLVRAQRCPRAAHGEDGRLSGQGTQPEGLDDGPHQPVGLAGAGRPDGQQRGAEQGGVQGQAGGPAGVGVVRVLGAAPDADLAGEHVVAGGTAGQVAPARGVQGGGSPGAEDGLGQGASRSGLRVASAQAWRRRATSTSFIRPVRTSAVRVSAASVQPAARSSGQRSAEVSVAGAGSSAGAGWRSPAGGDQLAPAAEAGEGPEDGGGDESVDDVDDGLALVDLAARHGGDEDQDRADDRQRLLPDEQLGEARRHGRREGEEGLPPVDDMAAQQLGEVADPAAAVDEEPEEEGLVHGEGVRALDGAGAAGGARVPPLARGEELERDEPVREVAVAPERPEEEGGEEGDDGAHDERPVGDLLALLGRARGEPEPPDARGRPGAGRPQPDVEGGRWLLSGGGGVGPVRWASGGPAGGGIAGTRGASGSPLRGPQGCPDEGAPVPGTFGGTAGGNGTPPEASAPCPRPCPVRPARPRRP